MSRPATSVYDVASHPHSPPAVSGGAPAEEHLSRDSAQTRALELFFQQTEWELQLHGKHSEEDVCDIMSLVNFESNVREAGGIAHYHDECNDAEVIAAIRLADDQKGKRIQQAAAPAIAWHAEQHGIFQKFPGMEVEVSKLALRKLASKKP